MSTIVKIIIGVLIALAVIAVCVIGGVFVYRLVSGPEEATATPMPTAGATVPSTVETEVDDSWDRVQEAGKIVVGTAADYPPFEYFVDGLKIDGFDIALMDEIGRRLGVQIEWHNFAFDGLGGALQLKQIDAAIAAVSITPERESVVDFTNGSNTVTGSIRVGKSPVGVGVSPDGGEVYAANSDSGTLSVIDTASNTVKYKIRFGSRAPSQVAVASDGTVYVALSSNEIAVLAR